MSNYGNIKIVIRRINTLISNPEKLRKYFALLLTEQIIREICKNKFLVCLYIFNLITSISQIANNNFQYLSANSLIAQEDTLQVLCKIKTLAQDCITNNLQELQICPKSGKNKTLNEFLIWLITESFAPNKAFIWRQWTFAFLMDLLKFRPIA